MLEQLRGWARELGFQQLAVADVDLSAYQPHLDAWLARNFHGQMDYMLRHRDLRVLSVRMDYLTRCGVCPAKL